MANQTKVRHQASTGKYVVWVKIGTLQGQWLADFDDEDLARQMAAEAQNISREDIPALRKKYRDMRLASKRGPEQAIEIPNIYPTSLDRLAAAARKAEREYAAAAQTAEHLRCTAMEAWTALKNEMKTIMAESRLAHENGAAVQVYSLIPRIGASDEFKQEDVQTDDWWRDHLREGELGQ